MDFDESLVTEILESEPSWLVDIKGKQIVPNSVDIAKSVIPVKKPSIRGGVYFSQTQAYKIKCIISDTSIVKILSSMMLGPNTDFTPIKIIAQTPQSKYTLLANLTNYVQTDNELQLSLILISIES